MGEFYELVSEIIVLVRESMRRAQQVIEFKVSEEIYDDKDFLWLQQFFGDLAGPSAFVRHFKLSHANTFNLLAFGMAKYFHGDTPELAIPEKVDLIRTLLMDVFFAQNTN